MLRDVPSEKLVPPEEILVFDGGGDLTGEGMEVWRENGLLAFLCLHPLSDAASQYVDKSGIGAHLGKSSSELGDGILSESDD
jgi:hypothetical protein